MAISQCLLCISQITYCIVSLHLLIFMYILLKFCYVCGFFFFYQLGSSQIYQKRWSCNRQNASIRLTCRHAYRVSSALELYGKTKQAEKAIWNKAVNIILYVICFISCFHIPALISYSDFIQ